MFFIKNRIILSILIYILLFTGCDIISKATSSEKIGIVVDNIVAGVKYIHESGEEGYTNEKGEFTYKTGNTKFYIGDIKVGEIDILPKDRYVFIQDMLGLPRDNINDEELIKVATLLQSLDSDNSTDIIEIKKEDLKKLETGTKKDIQSMSSNEIEKNLKEIFKEDIKNKRKRFKNKEEVKKHLEDSQKQYNNKVVQDKIKPFLKNSNIRNNDTKVSINTSIILQFNENIPKTKELKNYFSLRNEKNENIEFQISQEFDSKINLYKIKLNPKKQLSYKTLYILTIDKDLKDYAGNPLGKDKQISFTTKAEDEIAPVFMNSSSINVDENQLSAITLNALDDNSITYSISGDDASKFNINSSSGLITFKVAPDYEKKSSYTFTAKAIDSFSNFANENITININNLPEKPLLANTNFSINENISLGTSIGSVSITNSGDSNITSFSLTGSGSSSFSISNSGEITVSSNLDYESKSSYSLKAKATNGAGDSNQVDVLININDLDDSSPVFTNSSTISVNENQINSLTLQARDINRVTYSISGGDASKFNINSSNGVITFKVAPDYEKKSSYTFTAKASDSIGNFSTQNIIINIIDIDENKPVFTNSSTISVNENQLSAITLKANDESIVTYSISGSDASKFNINSSNGVITFKVAPDYEKKSSYTFTAKATDSIGNFSTQSITINIQNIAEVKPVLANTNFSINENISLGTSIGSVSITNSGDSNITSFTLTGTGSSSFSISSTGEISVSSSLDYESKSSYSLKAKATNGAGDSNQVDVLININDLDEGLPLLIVRIEFNDYTFSSDAVTWSQKIYGTNNGQLNHYFNEISDGKFQLIKAKETHNIANDGIITVKINENHPGNVDQFVTRLTSAINLANPFIDFSFYDKNSNGAISRDELQIMFLIAGGESSTGANPGVWAHKWCLQGQFGAFAPTVDSVNVMDCYKDGNYSRFGEKQFGHDATIGIIAHELGHAIFELPDLYDPDNSSAGIGRFGLMGGGSWGYKAGEDPGSTPNHMSAYSKIKANFKIPKIISSSLNNIELKGVYKNDDEILKINTKNAREYFLIENRAVGGYDLGMYSLENKAFRGGIAIWHIDENKSTNNDENHKLVDLEEANNPVLDSNPRAFGKITNLFFAGNNNSFTSSTTPNNRQYNGVDSGFSITNISLSNDSMYIDVEIK